jgi:hypothetical protein
MTKYGMGKRYAEAMAKGIGPWARAVHFGALKGRGLPYQYGLTI